MAQDPISTTVGSLIRGGLPLVGDIANIGFQWWAMRKQVEENKRAEALGLQIRAEDTKLSNKWKSKGFRLQMKQFGLQEDEFELMGEKFQWNKEQADLNREELSEQKNFGRIQAFSQNFVKEINQNRDFKNNLINTMGARRAA